MCNRWKGENSRPAWLMSNPEPLSRTKKSPFGARPTSTRARSAWPLNFQAFPSRFSSTLRSRRGSAEALRSTSITVSTVRPGEPAARSLRISAAIAPTSVGRRDNAARPTRDSSIRSSIISFIRFTDARIRSE
ncbi:hypothetical protein GCM10022223_43960 [Kineosporia mesophila]|uniref:Uncharacterized protein n=1 Tax=Kineosporia mesophila TaxID=566012 RepID=A0ABP6ZXQ2_9ACTN